MGFKQSSSFHCIPCHLLASATQETLNRSTELWDAPIGALVTALRLNTVLVSDDFGFVTSVILFS